MRPARLLVGGNSAYLRTALGDERFSDLSLGDDFRFSWSLWKRGARLSFAPGLAVTHLNRTGVRRVLDYQYRLGHAAARYRRLVSPKLVRVIAAFPPLLALSPPIVLCWAAGLAVRRCRPGQVARLALASPLLLIGNLVWAYGFYAGTRDG